MKRTTSFADLPDPDRGSEGTPIPVLPSCAKRPYTVGLRVFDADDVDAVDIPQDWDEINNDDLMAHEHLGGRNAFVEEDADANNYLQQRGRNCRALIEAAAVQ